MAGYWPSSFFACLWTETNSRSINTIKKRTRPISRHLDRTGLVNKGFIICPEGRQRQIFCLLALRKKPVTCNIDGACFILIGLSENQVISLAYKFKEWLSKFLNGSSRSQTHDATKQENFTAF